MATQTNASAGVSKVAKFLREVKTELRKVTWPGKKELIAYTSVVLVSVVIVAAGVAAVDFILSKGLNAFLATK